MVFRIALSSHDSVGLGHVRRHLAIAHALSRSLPELVGEPVTGMIITGQASATSFRAPEGWDWLVIPSVTVGQEGYASRHLTAGIDRVTAMRGGAIDAALQAFGPDLLLIDRHPFGVRRELTTALRNLRTHRPECAVVLGLRDVLDRPSVAGAEWKALGGSAAVREFFDAIWVYGDPTVHDMTTTGELPRGLHDLVSHTGFLSHGRPDPGRPSAREPFVLTTVGGGSDGGDLAEAAACATPPAGYRHIVVTGPQMPDARRAEIRAAAGENTTIMRSAPDVLALIRRAAAVVSMGGYNTVSEVMSTSTPALVVPRSHRRREQVIRANALAAVGAVDTVSSKDVTPDVITDFFARTVGEVTPRTALALDGLDAVAPLAAALAADVRASRKEIARAV